MSRSLNARPMRPSTINIFFESTFHMTYIIFSIEDGRYCFDRFNKAKYSSKYIFLCVSTTTNAARPDVHSEKDN